ncbi:hypothetical protein MPL1_06410 [Methylophaga lonarensis MPL]|uniref:DUF4340 domain-containing protein n=1 Tax=Methylophaga lonarensis MPL TaxID=1286106 RepID=M7P146_9GAMM|nr:DUF4340 domain-containing protein [Methylophaga lonarensis]EMR13211.1 hypothetical protein MPL1_06410 [Methylophaga lonarensis MPL]
MKRQLLTNLLLLIVILLAFWALRVAMQGPSYNTLADVTGKHTVSSIIIRRPDSPPVGLIEKSGQWHMQQPRPARASDHRAALILNLLSSPVYSEFYPFDSSGLQAFGLAQPRLTLQLDDALLLFGDTESLSGRRYVMHKGVIYLIDDDISPLLQAAAGSFVEPRILPEGAQLQRMTLPMLNEGQPDPRQTISLIQQQGSWRSDIKNPSFSSDDLVQLIQNWSNAYAMQVAIMLDNAVPENAVPVRIWLRHEDQPVVLWVEVSANGLLISHPEAGLRYLFPSGMLQQLFLQGSSTDA